MAMTAHSRRSASVEPVALCWPSRCCLAVSIAIQVVRDRGWAPYRAAESDAVGAVGPAGEASWRWVSTIWSRTSIGCAPWSITAASAPRARTAASQAANFDLLYPLLDLVTSLDPHFKVAYRFGAIFLTEAYPSGPAGPISRSRCCSAASSRMAGAGNTWRTSASSITGGCRTSRRRPSGSSAPASSPARRRGWRRWPRRRSPQGGDRRVVALAVDAAAARTRTSSGCAATPASAAAARRDGRDRRAERRSQRFMRARRPSAARLARAGGGGRLARHSARPDRHAVTCSTRPPGAIDLAEVVLWPLPWSRYRDEPNP